jgi:hypothetical protein
VCGAATRLHRIAARKCRAKKNQTMAQLQRQLAVLARNEEQYRLQVRACARGVRWEGVHVHVHAFVCLGATSSTTSLRVRCCRLV